MLFGMRNPEIVYTLAEAADLMRMTRRGVAKLGRRHGLCMVVSGRNITFTASQLAELQASITVERARARAFHLPPSSEHQLRKSLLGLTAKERNKAGGQQNDR
jgi:hypothetical protein